MKVGFGEVWLSCEPVSTLGHWYWCFGMMCRVCRGGITGDHSTLVLDLLFIGHADWSLFCL